MSYLKSIRKFCVECMGGNYSLIKDCTAINCKFYNYRFGKNPKFKPKYSPLKSIRRQCLECCGSPGEVKKCSIPECPIYIFRFGKNPKLKGKGNIESLKRSKKHDQNGHSGSQNERKIILNRKLSIKKKGQ